MVSFYFDMDFELYIRNLKWTSIVKDDDVNSWRTLSLTIDMYFNIKFHTRQMYGFPTLYKEPKGLSTSAMAVTNFDISVTLASTVILLI